MRHIGSLFSKVQGAGPDLLPHVPTLHEILELPLTLSYQLSYFIGLKIGKREKESVKPISLKKIGRTSGGDNAPVPLRKISNNA